MGERFNALPQSVTGMYGRDRVDFSGVIFVGRFDMVMGSVAREAERAQHMIEDHRNHRAKSEIRSNAMMLQTNDGDSISSKLNFEYRFAPIKALSVKTEIDETTKKSKITGIMLDGETFQASSRFWVSLYSRYGFNKAFFKYFDYPEVFERIAKNHESDTMRLCIERSEVDTDTGRANFSRLLGVSNENKPIVAFNDLSDTLTSFGGTSLNYADGIVESFHVPRVGAGDFEIAGDLFNNRFVMSCPVDGYGLPSAYLSLFRQVCTNGAVAYTKAFRSSLALGKKEDDVKPALIRMLDGFNNDEGFAAIRQRFSVAAKSWASVYEAGQVYDRLVKLHANEGQLVELGGVTPAKAKMITDLAKRASGQRPLGEKELNSPLFHAFHAMTGDTTQLYGLANLDALSVKRQRTLPVKATMYDLLNFVSEVSTHYTTPTGQRMMNSLVGDFIGAEYDLESTVDKFSDFDAFHVQGKLESGLTGSVPVLSN